MAAINFPDSPSNGDTHVVGNVTYVYDNAKAKWNGAGQTPNDRLTEGSNSLEINGSNNLVWTGNNFGIGTTNPQAKLHVESAATTAGWQIRTDSVGLNNESGFYRDASDNYEVVLRNGLGGLSFIKNDGGFSTSNLSFTVQGLERLRITSDGQLRATSAADVRLTLGSAGTAGTNDSVHIRADSANLKFMAASGGTTVFETNGTETLRIDSGGRIAQGGRISTSHGSPNLLLWGADPTMMIASTGATNNSSSVGIKFTVAGGSTGDYSKAGIFVQRQSTYTDLDMIFAFRSTADAAGVEISDEKVRIKSNGDLKHTGLRSGGGENKLAILVTPSHNTNEEDVIVYQVENESSFNQITFGGGTASYNAATTLAFNTATAVDTTGGQRALAIDSSQNILYYGATGVAGGPGGTNVTKRADVSANGSLNIQIPGVTYVGHLYVMSVFNTNATVRTSRIYFISGRYGNSPVITQLQTDNGSNGGRSFTITDVSAGSSNLIQFTDTSNSSVEVSMHFVGAIGL